MFSARQTEEDRDTRRPVRGRAGQAVAAAYACQDGPSGPGISACEGPVENGANLDTNTPGTHSFAVTATSLDGQSTTKSVPYTVALPIDHLVTRPHLNAHADGRFVFARAAATTSKATTLRILVHPNRNGRSLVSIIATESPYACGSPTPQRTGGPAASGTTGSTYPEDAVSQRRSKSAPEPRFALALGRVANYTAASASCSSCLQKSVSIGLLFASVDCTAVCNPDIRSAPERKGRSVPPPEESQNCQGAEAATLVRLSQLVRRGTAASDACITPDK